MCGATLFVSWQLRVLSQKIFTPVSIVLFESLKEKASGLQPNYYLLGEKSKGEISCIDIYCRWPVCLNIRRIRLSHWIGQAELKMLLSDTYCLRRKLTSPFPIFPLGPHSLFLKRIELFLCKCWWKAVTPCKRPEAKAAGLKTGVLKHTASISSVLSPLFLLLLLSLKSSGSGFDFWDAVFVSVKPWLQFSPNRFSLLCKREKFMPMCLLYTEPQFS